MKQSVTRRRFGAGTAAVFASIGIVKAPAKAAQYEVKFACNTAIEHPLTVNMVQMWNAIEKESGGRVHCQLFPNNQLGGDTAMLTQLRSGALQFFTLDGGILQSVVPVAAIQSIGFAFKSDEEAFKTMDGPLGSYVRDQIATKGLYAFPKMWANGMRQITSSTHPIQVASDLTAFKIRTPPGALWVDLFKSLGASPTPINFSEVYTALQTKVVDGQENPYAIIETARLFEVQKYLSVTNHMWSGFWFLANGDYWKTVPPDVQAIIERNAAKYALSDRTETALLNGSLADKLGRQGMVFNKADAASMRAKLGAFYAKWKGEFGNQAWSLLEASVGKLG